MIQEHATPGKWLWASGEPNNFLTEHCVEMFRDGSYNNLPCSVSWNVGYICERKVGKLCRNEYHGMLASLCALAQVFIFSFSKSSIFLFTHARSGIS